MRDYEQVNKERYEQDDFTGKGIENNTYSLINPVGNYGAYRATQVLRKYIHMLRDSTKKDLDEISLLDYGCGTGNWSRIGANLLGTAQNIYGLEYSNNRLRYCRQMNPAIHYAWGNIVGGVKDEFSDILFDGIMAVDVLSHIRKEQDIQSALMNIRSRLNPDGLFLWYEILSETHDANYEADTQGYSEKEIIRYAREAGFTSLFSIKQYKRFSILGRSFDTYYNVRDSRMGIVYSELIEKFVPGGKYLNVCKIFKKESK